METLDAIFTRRSVRKYKDNKIPGDIIETIIKAGMAAPTAKNQQIWHFVIIDSRELLDRIADFHIYGKMLYNAPIAILTCADMSIAKAPKFFDQDLSAATENMLLAIHDSGLGGVWLSIHPRRERMRKTSKLLNLPENIVPFTIIPFGYPDEEKEPSNRFMKERIHRNKWQTSS